MCYQPLSATEDLPLLCYDTALPVEELIENRPYRNIGDLLVRRSPSVQEMLLLCGADVALSNGECSDYECFRALCTVMPQLLGHRTAHNISELLRRVFGVYEPLSLDACDLLWEALNTAIEETGLTPLALIEALGITSISYRHSPHQELPDLTKIDLSLRPLFDMGITPESRMLDKENSHATYPSFVSALASSLQGFVDAECPAICLHIPRDYRYLRNPKKEEIGAFYAALRKNQTLSQDELSALRTALCFDIAKMAKEHNLHWFLHSDAPEEELCRLYESLKRKDNVPMTLLNTEIPHRSLLRRFAFRTEKGFPGILPHALNLSALASYAPIGYTVLATEPMEDIVSLSEGHCRRRALDRFLSAFGESEAVQSLAEDLAFGNIINRFGM